MASPFARRTLLRYARNSLFALPASALLLEAGATAAYANEVRSAGQDYAWQNVVTGGGGGFVPNILFNATQKDLIYARTDIGGAYRWEPQTETWTQLLAWISADDWNWSGVESVATDPVEPNRLYLAVGTYTISWAKTNGAILISEDYGHSFKRVDLPFKVGSNMPGRGMGERLAIDPNDNSILYFGARSGHGLWRSCDFGHHWEHVSNFPDTGPYSEGSDPTQNSGYLADPDGVVWVTFDPATGSKAQGAHGQFGPHGKATQTIYVGVAENGSGKPNIFQSLDGGATWAAIPGQPIDGYLPHQGKLDSQGTLYVTRSNSDGPYLGSKGDVYKYVPSTSTWTLISPVPGSSSSDYFGYGGLGIDMLQPGTVMVAAVNSWWPQGQMFRTTDGGATWTPAWTWGSWPNLNKVYTMDISSAPWLNFGNTNEAATLPVPAVNLGWMMEGLNIDPFNSDRMFYGTGASILGTKNLTAWNSGVLGAVTISSMATGIEETGCLGLISPPVGAPLYTVVGDVGGFVHTSLTTPPTAMYSVPYVGSEKSIDYAELKPTYIVRSGYKSGTTSAAYSTDSGTTWNAVGSAPAGLSGDGAIVVAADASVILWAGSGAAVSYSIDNGTTWKASASIPSGAALAADRVNPLKFYGYANGQCWLSTDGGATFTATAATGTPIAGDDMQIKAMPGHEGEVWLVGGSANTATSTGHVRGMWRSSDSGASFRKLNDFSVADVIGFGKGAPNSQYSAVYTSAILRGKRGVYRSDDAGRTWTRINDDQHQYATIQSITGDARIYGRVFCGTNGFGIVYGEPTG